MCLRPVIEPDEQFLMEVANIWRLSELHVLDRSIWPTSTMCLFLHNFAFQQFPVMCCKEAEAAVCVVGQQHKLW